jgi:hypothetical protein
MVPSFRIDKTTVQVTKCLLCFKSPSSILRAVLSGRLKTTNCQIVLLSKWEKISPIWKLDKSVNTVILQKLGRLQTLGKICDLFRFRVISLTAKLQFLELSFSAAIFYRAMRMPPKIVMQGALQFLMSVTTSGSTKTTTTTNCFTQNVVTPSQICVVLKLSRLFDCSPTRALLCLTNSCPSGVLHLLYHCDIKFLEMVPKQIFDSS